jgi:hypothetical protein
MLFVKGFDGSEPIVYLSTDAGQPLSAVLERSTLLTGVNPATGQPQLYGSVGVDIDCAVIGYTATAPTTPDPPTSPAPSSRQGSWQAAAGTLRLGGPTSGRP